MIDIFVVFILSCLFSFDFANNNGVLIDDKLYHVSKKKNVELRRKVVVGRKEANQIFVEFHASPYGAHCGTEKTKLAISSRFYWPGMGVDIDKWVTKPLELLGMDLVGKVTRTRKGNEYICVLVDYYTKWAEAYAIPNKSAAVVSRCIINFFYRFGAPKRILTDQGSEFVNQINSTVESVIAENTVSEAISLKEKMDHIVKENVGKKQERRHRVATQAPGRGGKLERSWLGPYEIVFLKEKSADLRDEKGHTYPKINTDHLKLFKEETPRVPHRLLQDEPQLKRPHQETSPSPVDIITKEEQPPPSPPSSPTAPKPSPCDSPKSSTSLSPLDLSAPLSSPVSHPTTLPTVIPADAKDAVHSYIKSAWAGNDSVVLLSKVGPHKLFYQDILQVGPGKELESEVINAYLMLKVRHHNLTSPEKAFHMDTFAITAMWNGKYQGLKVNPANYDVIVGIVNECHHWFLVAIYPSQKKTILLDPLGESDIKKKRCLETTREKTCRAFMRQKGIPVSRWVCESPPHPLQMDSTSCGVFALKFAEHILQNTNIDFSNAPQDVAQFRMEIASTLLEQSVTHRSFVLYLIDDLSDLCHFCGEAETFDDSAEVLWISCDYCGRWFHMDCVNNLSTEKQYKCFSCNKSN
ncbi:Gypsy retrotransposon integrase-like protein 1 [Labeo rohita]|uniref:Gypsy retrotransposon integrase-like protein 1 n=1 Tax=Labeo rohita TaxID=84645 RepID=A0ABQ8L481_LABRO|nr:Gypsy retrotransposon integrase-like protein 1 [Labeo rohita]